MGVAGSLTPVSRRRLHESVSEQLLRAIQAGEFPVDTRLPSERELSLDIRCHAPGRPRGAAIAGTARDSEISPGRARHRPAGDAGRNRREVHRKRAHPHRHRQRTRSTFQGGAASLRVRHRPPRRRTRSTFGSAGASRRRLTRQKLAISRRTGFVSLDGEFHATIAALTGNPLFPAVSRGIFNWFPCTIRLERPCSGP